MIEWPASVPYATDRSMWALTPYRNPLETEMQSGDVRSRATSADNLPLLTWGRTLEPAEALAYKAFVDGTLKRGALRHVMPVCLDGATYEPRVVQIQRSSLSYEAVAGGRLRPRCSLLVYPASLYPVVAPAGLAVSYPAPDSVRLTWAAEAGLNYRARATDWATGRVVARQDVTASGASAAATLACGPGTYRLEVARLVGGWTGPATGVTDTLGA